MPTRAKEARVMPSQSQRRSQSGAEWCRVVPSGAEQCRAEQPSSSSKFRLIETILSNNSMCNERNIIMPSTVVSNIFNAEGEASNERHQKKS